MIIENGPFKGAKRNGYACLYCDPPWFFRTRTDFVSDRDARIHYPVMGADAIARLPVADLAAPDAHLFLWVTGPVLEQSFAVIKAWGFRYSGVGFTWIKTKRKHVGPVTPADLHVGLGFTTRKNAEFCLLARRGNAKRLAKDVREVILSPLREHSRKPDEAYERIERYCAGPRVELFARAQRPGWAVYGNDPAL